MSIGNFAPKGSMCIKCVSSRLRCDHLPFHKMKVIDRCDLYKIVVCSEYKARDALINNKVESK